MGDDCKGTCNSDTDAEYCNVICTALKTKCNVACRCSFWNPEESTEGMADCANIAAGYTIYHCPQQFLQAMGV